MLPDLLNRKLEKMMLWVSVRSNELGIVTSLEAAVSYVENGKCRPTELAGLLQCYNSLIFSPAQF